MPRKSRKTNNAVVRTRMTTRRSARTALYNMPQEIIDYIVTMTQPDLRTAKACSVVCRSWRDASQKIVLSCIRTADTHDKNLCILLSQSDRMRHYATHLRYDILRSKDDFQPPIDMASEDTQIDTIVGSLPNLKSLFFDGSATVCFPPFTRAVLDLLKNPEFENLELVSMMVPSATEFLQYLQGSGLKRLRLETIWPWPDSDAPWNVPFAERNDPCLPKIHLTELVMDIDLGEIVTTILTSPALLCLAGLRVLHIDTYMLDEPLWLMRGLCSVLTGATVLNKLFLSIPSSVPVSISTPPSLTDLLDRIFSLQEDYLPTLTNCHQLRVLDVGLYHINPPRPSVESDGLRIIVELIRSIPVDAPVTCISLYHEVGCPEEVDNDASWIHKWNLLEEALLPNGDASLKPHRVLDLLYTGDDISASLIPEYMPQLKQLNLLKLRTS